MNKVKLARAGVDYKSGVNRFSGNWQLYDKYLLQLFSGDTMERLTDSIERKDYHNAFLIAHELKGTSGNLSADAIYINMVELTDYLRTEPYDEEKIAYYHEKVKGLYYEAKAIVKPKEV